MVTFGESSREFFCCLYNLYYDESILILCCCTEQFLFFPFSILFCWNYFNKDQVFSRVNFTTKIWFTYQFLGTKQISKIFLPFQVFFCGYYHQFVLKVKFYTSNLSGCFDYFITFSLTVSWCSFKLTKSWWTTPKIKMVEEVKIVGPKYFRNKNVLLWCLANSGFLRWIIYLSEMLEYPMEYI